MGECFLVVDLRVSYVRRVDELVFTWEWNGQIDGGMDGGICESREDGRMKSVYLLPSCSRSDEYRALLHTPDPVCQCAVQDEVGYAGR